ncbi:MAG TPA: hypothetical protein PKU97_18760 [Kofleriaceae bacterium]|nr:hypothetical protein [Kofleriaceae bacterium]
MLLRSSSSFSATLRCLSLLCLSLLCLSLLGTSTRLASASSDALGAAASSAPPSEALVAARDSELASGQFLSLDHTTGRSGFGLQASYLRYDTSQTGTTMTPLRLEVFGQIMGSGSVGAYTSAVMSRIDWQFTDPPPEIAGMTFTDSAITGLEFGAVMTRRRANLEVIARAGVSLPAASDHDINGKGLNQMTAFARLTDLAMSAPSSTVARLAVSPIWRAGRWLLRADVGIDVPVDEPAGMDWQALGRFNAAAGLVIGAHQVGLESATTVALEHVSDGERAVHTVGLSYRHLGALQPFFGLQQTVATDVWPASELELTVIGGISAEFTR